ncbi:DUF2231 domain-containing protein [soil metagenome]
MNPLAKVAADTEELRALDPAVAVVRTLTRPVSEGTAAAVLGGAWLGHPAHPLLVTGPIGLLGAAGVLDAVGGEEGQRPAEWLLGFGLLALAPSVATGMSDWSRAGQRAQRVGLVHAVVNLAGGTIAWQSYRARRRGELARGRRLLRVALAAIGVGGYLGGHLTYVLGVRVAD